VSYEERVALAAIVELVGGGLTTLAIADSYVVMGDELLQSAS
jgi:hypothetical protein